MSRLRQWANEPVVAPRGIVVVCIVSCLLFGVYVGAVAHMAWVWGHRP